MAQLPRAFFDKKCLVPLTKTERYVHHEPSISSGWTYPKAWADIQAQIFRASAQESIVARLCWPTKVGRRRTRSTLCGLVDMFANASQADEADEAIFLGHGS